MTYLSESDSCYLVNVIDGVVASQKLVEDSLEFSLTINDVIEEDCVEVVSYLNWIQSYGPLRENRFEELGQGPERPLPSIEKPPILELKALQEHLRYAYLGEKETLPVIVSSYLSKVEVEELLRVLRVHKTAIGWTLADIRGIIPSIVVHRILMKDDAKLTIDAQRRLNPIRRKWLAGHNYYCVLDGYSRYHQITIAPEDQEKTTFTCPYGTFEFRRMPFGLCNAAAMFQRCMMAILFDMVEKGIEIFMDDFFSLWFFF
ncbi:uncharacterized protein LOC133779455 [Humulus lupulus]|uniref:uncharacterized protein LOC133779455 n=1 Tax=Humulus lupulus TaxID=3486 RepID=UPI002B40283C|nr:uncharacterized protein LOC133779455 [Humulus lupulus]